LFSISAEAIAEDRASFGAHRSGGDFVETEEIVSAYRAAIDRRS